MIKQLVRLAFPDALIQEPIVYRIGREFRIVTSIFRASVGEKDAWVVLELDGEGEEISRCLNFLQGQGIEVEKKSETDIF